MEKPPLLRRRRGSQYRADINVTPLVDVVLVLLIIFMVITPMLQRGVDLRLPESLHHRTEGNPADPIVISVNHRGQLHFDRDLVTVSELEERLRNALIRTPGREILLKGDEHLVYGQIREVLKAFRKVGAGTVALATARPGES